MFVYTVLTIKHDIFISYSSKNSTTAQAICHELEDNVIKCWMVPRDIPVGSKYASVITQAIKECKAVVHVFSEQSAISPWVESEINIAFSNRMPIVPYKIDRTNLENYDEFYLMLNNLHWIEAYPDFKTRFAELVAVVASVVGTIPTDKKDTAAKAYKIGDYYNENGLEGVVFEVWDGGKHGKIISPDETEAAWDSRVEYDNNKWEYVEGTGTRTYADSESDGKANTDKIMARSDSRYFDAFEWCRAKGSSWYLPAKDELKQIYQNKAKLNSTLSRYGTDIDDGWHWSSTENADYEPKFFAWLVTMNRSYTYSTNKGSDYYVRAVYAF